MNYKRKIELFIKDDEFYLPLAPYFVWYDEIKDILDKYKMISLSKYFGSYLNLAGLTTEDLDNFLIDLRKCKGDLDIYYRLKHNGIYYKV